MRVGLTVSIIGHAAILGIGLIAFPNASPFAVEEIDALPVDLVDIDEVTDLLQGSEESRLLPEEAPQPVAEVEAPTPEPVEEKVAETPVEAARAPTPPPPPAPEPEPVEEEVAALPEPPEPPPPPEPEPEAIAEPEPAPQPPPDARKPRARPNPPRQAVEEPKPPEPVREAPREVAQQPPPEPKQEFNPDDIAALLNKQQPAGGGAPSPSPEPQTIGSIDGNAEAAMTQSEIAALKARLYRCWNPPVAVREAAYLVVEVRISLLPDGSLAGSPELISVGAISDPLAQVAVEAAIRAVQQCAPFGDILRPETYALWNQIDFVFDPREMLGG